jgi:hypothetical protein
VRNYLILWLFILFLPCASSSAFLRHCKSGIPYLTMDKNLLIPRAGGQADFDFYIYNPSNVAGYIFVILFAIGTVTHLGYICRYKSWFFIPFTLGCAGKSFYSKIPTHPPLHHHHDSNAPSQPKQAAITAAPGRTTTSASAARTSSNSSS